MSSRKLSRERGTTISCDHGCYEGEGSPCTSRVYTALVYVKPTRRYAATLGWIRGGAGRRRRDYCPEHAPAERKRVAEAERVKAERKKERDAAKQAARAAKQPRSRSRTEDRQICRSSKGAA